MPTLPWALDRKLPRTARGRVVTVVAVLVLAQFYRQSGCYPRLCSLIPTRSEVGIRLPEPSLGPRADTTAAEIDGCRRLNTLEKLADGMLAADETTRENFDATLAKYQHSLSSWRKGLRATQDLGGPRQPRCRADSLGEMAHAAGMRLPEEYQKAVLGQSKPKGSTWGQYTDLMMSLATSLGDSAQCRDFHMVATWIWQWCSYGDWYLLSFDSDYERLMPYIEDGMDYGNPGIKWQYHWGRGWFKEERIQHMTHAQIHLRALGVHPDLSNIAQIVEFGGGTGDMCAATMDMGYQGTYVIYVSRLGTLECASARVPIASKDRPRLHECRQCLPWPPHWTPYRTNVARARRIWHR
eukprot:SAG31_NODE_5493_length_2502_cov_4.810653_1_plen_353_part_00